MASSSAGAAGSGGAVYGLGTIGAWVYFWQQADGFWPHALGFLEGIVWPALLVFDVLETLH